MGLNLFDDDHFGKFSNPNIWWFNVDQKRRVFVDKHDDHFSHVAKHPELYGIEPQPTQQAMKETLYENGWVRLKFANEGELNAEASHVGHLRKAISDSEKLHPNVSSVYIEVNNGDYWVLTEEDIHYFIKYGKTR